MSWVKSVLLVAVAAFLAVARTAAWAGEPRGCGGFTPKVLREIALEYVEQELSGIRQPSGSPCLDKLKLRWGRLEPDPVQEAGHSVERVPDSTPVRVISVRSTGPSQGKAGRPGRVTAEFELKLQGKWVRDRIRFMLNWNPAVQQEMGCTGLLEAPNVWRVRQSCAR